MDDLYGTLEHWVAPKSKEEFEVRYHEAAQFTGGVGPNGTKVHVPCPFCAAPDWLVHRLVDTQRAYRQGAVCRRCQRAAHAEVDTVNGYTSISLVQSGGVDPPAWITIKREGTK